MRYSQKKNFCESLLQICKVVLDTVTKSSRHFQTCTESLSEDPLMTKIVFLTKILLTKKDNYYLWQKC